MFVALANSVNFYQPTKILDWFNLKAFANDNINVHEMLKFGVGREENFVGKGENTGSFSYIIFKTSLLQGRVKSGLCGKDF